MTRRRGAHAVPDLVARAREGDPAAVARLITLVEDASPLLREVMSALGPDAGRAHVVGITGAPGVGKSTSTNALVAGMRRAGKRVGVLAIDPSSPFSGGALLGDRVRMGDHALDRDVYIRSMGARGHLGGLAWSTPQAVRVLDAAGCDVVVVETVGVGQSEVEVAGLADTTLVLLAPGMGDGIQAAKAGILEIGDVYAVNKADREGADRTRRELRTMLTMAERRDGAWRPPVLQTVASTGQGIDELLAEVDRHAAWLRESGELARRRTVRARREVEAIALAALRERWGRADAGADLDALAERVVAGAVDPYAAADELLADGRSSRLGRRRQRLVDVVGEPAGPGLQHLHAHALGGHGEQVALALGRRHRRDHGVAQAERELHRVDGPVRVRPARGAGREGRPALTRHPGDVRLGQAVDRQRVAVRRREQR